MFRRCLPALLAPLLFQPEPAHAFPVPPTGRTESTPIAVALRRVSLAPWSRRPPLVGYRLTRGPGLRVRFPRRAWGTWLTVSRLRELGRRYSERFPGAPPLSIHDLSKRGGGRLVNHFSHREGRDVDIAMLLRNPRAGYVDATPRSLDVERTWFVMRALLATCDVEFIMLDRELQAPLWRYLQRRVPADLLPMLIQFPGRWRGALIRHRDHHRNHIHVRFRRDGHPPEREAARFLCAPTAGGRRLMDSISAE